MANIDALKASGMNVEALSADQQHALTTLEQSEVDALVAIREKLNGEPEVGGYAMAASGNLIW